ncbi:MULTISPECIES: efflux RND transporter periplasmic adaptor subunit [Maricaulis]|uniref:Efflux transporter, RND family, MFP subunit n=1 Tax=Maricaulis maris (strain MCS10) TaxID=394221 RepID=Q0AT28_MARMM|nr:MULTISPECIES: efflux RND transporter periplasmic adaptor subunit [Maricaulis]ABI64559.1 efflux transporter, RND family, MFP subunit [Maricaulis maris MCS10]MAC89064.1 efflux RND transporter periplasmic adaptor subunit [Maricaulis sp.]
MHRARFLVVVLVAFLAMTAIIVVRALMPAEDGAMMRGERVMAVAVAGVPEVEFADIVEALGTARANETVTITARVTDTISRINFESGQQVEAGAILVELTDTEEAAGLAEARTTLREAQRDLTRATDLVARAVVPQSRLDEATAVVERARARVSSIEAQLADRIVRAPFAGIVGLREVSLGGLVRPGDAIARLDDASLIKLDFTVPERFLSVVSAGMQIAARTSAYPDEVFTGAIAQVDSRIDPVTRSVTIRAEIENSDSRLLPGQLMTVEVRRDERRRPAVPGSALTRYLDQTFVYVVEERADGMFARQRTIALGRRSGQMVEVLDGLQAGDRIITEGVHRIRDGSEVRITRELRLDAGGVVAGTAGAGGEAAQ